MPPPPAGKHFEVLITGYGPFSYITDNPSWKCIAELHDTTLKTAKAGHTIHITCLGPLRVSYTGVLALAPLIHSRPPSFPPLSEILHERTSLEPNLEAPAGGWDLTLHLGAGGNGAVKLETIGHKTGYASGDVDGTLPPIVRTDLKGEVTVSEAELWERKRLDQGTSDKPNPGITRGYAEGYELFPEELKTEVDVDGLVRFLRETLGDERIIPSIDAGHYLCDFICYGSLAESQRPLFYPKADASLANSDKRSKSLFMHVPYDLGKPFSLEELTTVMKNVVAWVCTGEGI